MTDINEENKDLIENTTPFGLLEHETRHRLMAWKHGWQVWQPEGLDHWSDVTGRSSVSFMAFANNGLAYRAKPAPEPEPEPEPVEVLHEVSITVESPLLAKEMHFKLTFDAKLENPTIEEIK